MTASATTETRYRFVDADGHALEPPTGLQEFAAAATSATGSGTSRPTASGQEWVVADGNRLPANVFSLGGRRRIHRRREAARPRRRVHLRRGLAPELGREAAHRVHGRRRHRRVGAVPHADAGDPGASRRRLRGRRPAGPTTTGSPTTARRHRVGSTAPRCSRSRTSRRAPPSSAASRTCPAMVGGFLRPNPTVDWKHFNDEVYDPIWQAASDTNLALGFHPYLDAMLPGAAQGLRIGMLRMQTELRKHDARRGGQRDPRTADAHRQHGFSPGDRQPRRHDDVAHVHHDGRRVRALPRRCASCSSRRTAAGSCRGSSASTTTPTSSRGTCRGSR